MRRSLPLALILGLLAVACYSSADFQEESALSRCALYDECGYLSALDGVETFEDCLELLRSDAYACEEFDAQAAKACIDALEVLTCEEYGGGGFPMACVDACTLAE
ncbi:MAG: hypothetical protein ABIO70_13280 [Pseudomonadota bacterium]